ncbi:MAG: hypothetical protein ABSE90_02325 [Verrucomicrobiota bacterium]|jgi:hypothetical protein
MQITLKPMRRAGSGYVLIITLVFMAAALLVLASIMSWTATSDKLVARNNQFNRSTAAAEAATEMAFSRMDRDFLNGKLNSVSDYNTLIPDTSAWPVHYTFSDTNGNANTTYISFDSTSGTNLVPLNAQYSGLQAFVQNCQIISVATPGNVRYTVPATVSETFQAASIPIFQFAIFYNLNMEMDPTPIMTVNGSVFCNKSMWITCINGLTFNSTVQAVGTVTLNTAADPFANGYSYGGSTAVTFLMAKQPSSGNNALTVPVAGNATADTNPTNIEAILNLPPTALGAPNTVAYAESNQVYLFNASDIIISNASWGTNGIANRSAFLTGTNVNLLATNFTLWYQDGKNTTSPLTQLTNDYLIQKKVGTNYASTNILYAGFSFLTNVVFYDWREGYNGGSGPPKPVQAVQIDIGKFNNWLTNSALQGPQANKKISDDYGHGIGSIYVYNSVPLTSTTLPAVRLANGSQLPAAYPGLTVATPQPAYVWKDYNVQRQGASPTLGSANTSNTYPAAVLADAITILSTSWSDAYTNKLPTGTYAAGNTTINAAMFEGIVQSNTNIVGSYSGGVENFLRYLEDWNNFTNTYNGSMVVMFPSIYATNYYKAGGTYYNPPTRKWAFDCNFTNQSGMPKCGPRARALVRGNWKAY